MTETQARRKNTTVAALVISSLLWACQSWAGAARVATTVETAAVPNAGPAGLSKTISGVGSPVMSLAAPGLISNLSTLTPAPAAAAVKTAAVLSPSGIIFAAPAAAVPVSAPQAEQAAGPSAPVAKLSEAVSAEVQVIAKPDIGAEDSSSAGQRMEDIITGRRSVGSGDISAAVLAAPEQAASPSQLAPSAPSVEKAAAKPSAPAQAVKPVEGRFAYNVKRKMLAAVASIFGVTASLPPSGPQLAAAVLAEAGHKRVVFSDFDDTLGPYNSVLTPEMAAALAAIRKAGKEVAVITDRTDVSGGNQRSAFESLAAIPAADRAGMYVAAVSGGKVYRYDEKGEPVKVWEYPAFDESRRGPVLEAIAALKSQLPALGTSQHPGDAKNPAESWGPYSYAMMLAVGTPEAAVKNASRLFEAELRKRGLDVKVNARVPKDPANPAYIQFSIVDKSFSVKYIAGALGVEPWEALALGDNMYVPQSPEHPSRLAALAQRLAERIAGRPLPFTGNETDRNMEKALPGMLALSVGNSADPRMAHAYVLPGKGAAASLEVLRSVASRPADTADPLRYWKLAGAALVLALVVAGIFAGWYAFYHAFFEAASRMVVPGPGIGDLF
ncbi:MAG: hypothetical protein NTY77_03545 [Elusimicrobia bacterium]|nr:hypothetical protein [Elusimicrobiota bacterium]